MQELRLVGVQEDGEHLLLSNDDGEEFSLPVTDALRAAAIRPLGRPSAHSADAASGTMSPRDIQARIRAGASAEQVASASGLDLERIRRYEGPVLAERDWTARLARQVEVATPVPGHDLYRSTFGDEPATLDEMVRHRLSAMGMDSSTLAWDAWRGDDGSWTVTADFSTEGLQSSVGDQPPAIWSFRPSSRHLDNRNRWAQVLSELDPLDGPYGTRRLSAVGDRPFNVEEDDDVPSPGPFSDAPAGHRGVRPSADTDAQDELLDVLRARRGQRLGVDEEGDDQLALMLTRDEQPTAPPNGRPRLTVAGRTDGRAEDDATGTDTSGGSNDAEGSNDSDGPKGSGGSEDSDPAAEESGERMPGRWVRPLRTVAGDDPARPGQDTVDVSGPREQLTGQTDALDGAGHHDEDGEADDAGADADTDGPGSDQEEENEMRESLERSSGRKRPGGRQRRPSVPSWDEIVFGKKHD